MNPILGMIGSEYQHGSIGSVQGGTQLQSSSSITPDIYGMQLSQPSQSSLEYVGDVDYDDSSIGLHQDESNLMFNYTDHDDTQDDVDEHQNYEYYHDSSNDQKFGIDSMMTQQNEVNVTQSRSEINGYKKILPVKRPGLVLKTPIAYQGDIDPSVIPIQRDGMGRFCLIYFTFVSLYYFKEYQFLLGKIG